MKALFTILLSVIFLSTASANNFGDIKIGSNGKTSTIEVRMNSKKATAATITILNAQGVVVSTQKANLTRGDNNIALVDIQNLEEGTFTVTLVANNQTHTTQFMNWK